jgi:hypothetical protein
LSTVAAAGRCRSRAVAVKQHDDTLALQTCSCWRPAAAAFIKRARNEHSHVMIPCRSPLAAHSHAHVACVLELPPLSLMRARTPASPRVERAPAQQLLRRPQIIPATTESRFEWQHTKS